MKKSQKRIQNIVDDLYSAARKGLFSADNVLLYPTEIKRLENKGFFIHNVERALTEHHKTQFICSITWNYVYIPCAPRLVEFYIEGSIKNFPWYSVKNLAQELYVIARKAQNNKNSFCPL